MLRIAVIWLAGALGFVLASKIVPGIAVAGWEPALWAALILGVINVVIRPVVMLVMLPINVITLGLFGVAVNALIFWFIGSVVDGVEVSGILAALLGSIIVALIVSFADRFVSSD